MDLGGEAVVSCEADGEPKPLIAWKRVNTANELKTQQNTQLPAAKTSRSKLHVKNMRREDSGNYACLASNGVGEDLSANFTIRLKGTKSDIIQAVLQASLLNFAASHSTCISQDEALKSMKRGSSCHMDHSGLKSSQ